MRFYFAWLITVAVAAAGWKVCAALPYDVGTPVLTDIWVDPVNGNDGRTGATRAQALRSVNAAWARIPQGIALATTGYRVMLAAGDHTAAPTWWEGRYGARQFPVIIQSADGTHAARLPNLDVFDCRYFYLIGVHVRATGGDALHFASCRNILVRQVKVVGIGNIWNYEGPQEATKINQSQYIYIEGSDISGGWDNAVDFVAVQYGHVINSKIHRGLDWCMYLKGGSSYFTIEGNEFFDGGTGGFTAGQGTGFEYMVNPWLHYEAENVKFINNVVHHTGTVGVGVNGGYNILIAYNTLYKAGTNDHAIEVVQGARGCDGNTTACLSNNAAGGWGTTGAGGQYIPSRNVFIYNNVIYNPPGFGSRWQHFAIAGPVTPPPGSNVPDPARADTNLRIMGNAIWNDPAGLPLGFDSAVTLSETQVRADNSVNRFQPQLVDPEHGNYRPVPGGNLFGVTTYAIPAFPSDDRASPPLAPLGDLVNRVASDFSGMVRYGTSPPGAFTLANSRQSVRADFDHDRRSDLAVYWAATGGWYVLQSASGTQRNERWGGPGAWPAAADYDGDGRADPAVYWPSSGQWNLLLSDTRTPFARAWGFAAAWPVPGDYDGDGRDDLAVYDPAGRWYVRTIFDATVLFGASWGFPGALPVTADYDGDRRADLAIFYPAGGKWYIRSVTGRVLSWALDWGFAGCKPVPGDYDGDGRADLALFHPATGRWYILTLAGTALASGLGWGFDGCVPVPGDYDGDGRADLALYYQPRGTWYIWSLTRGVIAFARPWGWRDAVPVIAQVQTNGQR